MTPTTSAQALSLVHRLRPARPAETTSADSAIPLLILLHGLGSNEDDLFGLTPYLDPRWTIVSARAPRPYGNGGYAWFDLDVTAEGVHLDLAMAERCRTQISAFVREAQAAYGGQPARTFLGGFSQGAIMSASVLLTEPALMAGAVLMSGMVLPDLPLAPQTLLTKKPVILTHGTFDEVLPVQFAHAARDVLTSLDLAVTYHEYPMGHTISEESLETIDTWLTKRLS